MRLDLFNGLKERGEFTREEIIVIFYESEPVTL